MRGINKNGYAMECCFACAVVKGVQTFVAMVFLSLCTARCARLLLASKSKFEQEYFCHSPRKVSVCWITALSVCSAQCACAKCVTSGFRKKLQLSPDFTKRMFFFLTIYVPCDLLYKVKHGISDIFKKKSYSNEICFFLTDFKTHA